MRSLLSKSLFQFFICTGIIFLLIAPLFYLLTRHFYAEEIVDIIESVQQGNAIPPLDLEEDIMIGMMIQFLLIFGVLSLSLLITMRFITSRLWQPFDDTLQKTEQFNLAQNDIPRFRQTDIKEFARLNHSLKRLMEKDQASYRIQKEFTENASHELQTPIAIIRSKLDLLMQEELNERQMNLISDLYDINTRIGHLNRNLLLLAKIENAQYQEMEDIDLMSFINTSLPMYEALKNGLRLSVRDNRTCQSMLRANFTLLECLLNNLIVNAMRHTTVANGEVGIIVGDSYLTVNNEGEGIPLDVQTLFQRFRFGDTKKVGNGLGLAIVKAICDYHKWKIQYSFENNLHVFTVLLK